MIDLQGRVALPGFIDTHVHLDCTATHTKLATSCHIPPVDYVEVKGGAGSLDAILGFVKAQAQQTPKGEWIIGQGRFSLETDGNSPTKEPAGRGRAGSPGDDPLQRPRAAAEQPGAGGRGDRPGHALPGGAGRGLSGRANPRDPESGEPTGVVSECVGWILGKDNPWPYDALKGAIEATCREAVSFGVTSAHEFVSWSESARIYQELYREGALPLRIQLCPAVWGLYQTADVESLVELGIQTGFGNDWLKFGSAKIFVDGEGRDEEGVAREWPRITQDRLNELVLGAHRAGIRVMMHATSREGQVMAIEAVEAALKAAPRSDHRHRIEHFAGDYWPEGLARLKRLGIIPVPTPYSSLGWYGDAWLDAGARARRSCPTGRSSRRASRPPETRTAWAPSPRP